MITEEAPKGKGKSRAKRAAPETLAQQAQGISAMFTRQRAKNAAVQGLGGSQQPITVVDDADIMVVDQGSAGPSNQGPTRLVEIIDLTGEYSDTESEFSDTDDNNDLEYVDAMLLSE